MTTDSPHPAELSRLLDRFGLHLPDLRFIERDALSNNEGVQVHTTDRTPVIFDPTHGSPGGPRESCADSRALDIGGKSVTGVDGKVRWKLTSYICEDIHLSVEEPAAFVATPRSTVPVMMTTNTVATGPDLEIDVFSWTPAGDPAPFVRFSWRCWVQQPPVIL